MQVVKNFRSEVFREAHELVKQIGCSFSEALKDAWAMYRIAKEKLKKQVIESISEERAEKIARNINAFDTRYHYIDGQKWFFWNDLYRKISTILETFKPSAKAQVLALCQPQQAQFFGL